MVTWLRRRRRAWTAFITVLFTASMLSVACDGCQARERPQDRPAGPPVHHHCMPDGGGVPASSDSNPSGHCPGVCDCDHHDLAGMELRSQLAHTADLHDHSGQAVIRVVDLSVPPSVGPDQYRTADPGAPERACFKPLERYCVLLD